MRKQGFNNAVDPDVIAGSIAAISNLGTAGINKIGSQTGSKAEVVAACGTKPVGFSFSKQYQQRYADWQACAQRVQAATVEVTNAKVKSESNNQTILYVGLGVAGLVLVSTIAYIAFR